MNELEFVKNEVFVRRPALEKIYKNFGELTLSTYIKDRWQRGNNIDQVFLKSVSLVAADLFNKDTSDSIINQLKQDALVSTIDHHGLLNHPVFLNSSLIYSLRFQKKQPVVIFSTESVSLNNSCWSGCFLYHENNQLHRCSFFPDKIKMSAVFAAPKITQKEIEQFKRKSKNRFNQILDRLDFEKGKNFSEQASFLSKQLWQLTFPSAPEVLYLPLETIVSDYILNISQDTSHPLTKIIFSAAGQRLWQKYFGHEHTFMFWGVDSKGHRLVKSEVDDDIISRLRARQAYASSPLCFMVLLYAGMACVGGCNQTTWLTNIANNFVELLAELEPANHELIEKIKNIPTQNFAEGALASLKIGEMVVQPSGIDLITGGVDYYDNYKQVSEKMTLAESLDLSMPDLYTFVVPPHERV